MSNSANLKVIEETLAREISSYFSMMSEEGKIVSHLDAIVVAQFPLLTPFFDETKNTLAGRVETHFEIKNSAQNNDEIPGILKEQPEGKIFPIHEISQLTKVARVVEIQATLTFTLTSEDKITKELVFGVKV